MPNPSVRHWWAEDRAIVTRNMNGVQSRAQKQMGLIRGYYIQEYRLCECEPHAPWAGCNGVSGLGPLWAKSTWILLGHTPPTRPPTAHPTGAQALVAFSHPLPLPPLHPRTPSLPPITSPRSYQVRRRTSCTHYLQPTLDLLSRLLMDDIHNRNLYD